jgi:hypothetical protein
MFTATLKLTEEQFRVLRHALVVGELATNILATQNQDAPPLYALYSRWAEEAKAGLELAHREARWTCVEKKEVA